MDIKIGILLPEHIGQAPGKALSYLEKTLFSKGYDVKKWGSNEKYSLDIIMLIPEYSDDTASDEGFHIFREEKNGIKAIHISGSGDRGLMYGIFELSGQIGSVSHPCDIFELVVPVKKQAFLEIRSVCLFLTNSYLEKEWLYDREFWEEYFMLLAQSRFNSFTLVFGHQTPYFAPPFPFMLDVPGYGHIKVPSLDDGEKAENLKMLKMISETAGQWGIDFVMGIWQQNAHGYQKKMIEGLSYEDLFDYCPKGLALLLEKCPSIKGVQFRMNNEAVIGSEHQEKFFRGLFDAVKNCGRTIRVDLRAKGLGEDTIAAAHEILGDFVMSTKYWREHMGLPYMASGINPADLKEYRRYGYADILRENRRYRVLYRLWTIGSQKILLWGDMRYTSVFAKSCDIYGGSGFEICAPLSNKGYGNMDEGQWHIMEDPADEYYRWEQMRYWAYYMSFGLAGYDPKDHQPVYSSEFRSRFGIYGDDVMQAFESAGGIIPHITAFHAPSSSTFRYWPEIYTGGLSDTYGLVPSGDEGRISSIYGYVENYLRNEFSGKTKPPETACRLTAMAENTERALKKVLGDEMDLRTDNKELQCAAKDLGITTDLARYHSFRIMSTMNYLFFCSTRDRYCLDKAIKFLKRSAGAWRSIVRISDGYFYSHMRFNNPAGTLSHWKYAMPLLEKEIERLEKIDRLFERYAGCPMEASGLVYEYDWQESEMRWTDKDGRVTHYSGSLNPSAKPPFPLYEYDQGVFKGQNTTRVPESLISEMFSDISGPIIAHLPLVNALPDTQTAVYATLIGAGGKNMAMYLNYRRNNGSGTYSKIRMRRYDLRYVYRSFIPAACPGETVEYYLEAKDNDGNSIYSTDPGSPHRYHVVVPGMRAVIIHEDIDTAFEGDDIDIRFKTTENAGIKKAVLHFRKLVHTDEWQLHDMAYSAGGHYQAVIPGSFTMGGYDMSYALEVIFEDGTGTFYPDADSGRACVIIKIKRGIKR